MYRLIKGHDKPCSIDLIWAVSNSNYLIKVCTRLYLDLYPRHLNETMTRYDRTSWNYD